LKVFRSEVCRYVSPGLAPDWGEKEGPVIGPAPRGSEVIEEV